MSTVTTPRPSIRPKEFHFPLVVDWVGARRVSAQVEGKQPVEVCPPPVFRGDDPTAWSAEDLLVASAASCLAVTFTGIAERAGFEYERLAVAGDGVCGRRPDGLFGFTRLTLRVELETQANAAEARELVEQAEANCLVAASLDVPIETVILVNES